jgi:hypothetical protein
MVGLCIAILSLLQVQTGEYVETILSPRIEDSGFGTAVVLEGDYRLVGTRSRAVYVFEKDGNSWVERQRLDSSGDITAHYSMLAYNLFSP